MVAARELDEWLARLRLDVRRVDDGQQPALEPLRADEVQRLERGRRRGLVVLVVRDQSAAVVERQCLERSEPRARKGRLPGPGCADEDDERQLGNGERRHAASGVWAAIEVRAKIPICVGAPTSASTGPTGANRT